MSMLPKPKDESLLNYSMRLGQENAKTKPKSSGNVWKQKTPRIGRPIVREGIELAQWLLEEGMLEEAQAVINTLSTAKK